MKPVLRTAMNAQRERARAAGKFGADYGDKLDVSGATAFHGYEQLAETATITALFRQGDCQ